jgi:maleylpyruvate isomerase
MHWMPVSTPAAAIEMVSQASRRVLHAADALGDDEVAEPCALPGWSRAELLTHLARNADGFRRLAEAARAGTVTDMYPGGAPARAADIAAGRGRSANAVRTDLRRAADALQEEWEQLPDDRWEALGRLSSRELTIASTVTVRCRELEVHHVDLGVGYTPTDWPVAFVTRELDEVLRTLPSRASRSRPELDARYRIDAIDHGRAWIVVLHGSRVSVREDDRSSDGDTDALGAADVDAVVSGWGCDLLAWLLGRNTGSDTVTTSGRDVTALRLSTWFPYP